MKIPKLKYNDIVEIIWLDATSDSSWRYEDKVKKDKPAICHTVGYYVTQDKVAIVVSPDWSDSKERSSIVLPLGMMKKIRKLK